MTRSLTVVILAAGVGTRLRPLTDDMPKALVRAAGKPLIAYTIEWARQLSPQKIVVVGGYKFEQLQALSGVTLVHNPDYASTRRMHSLYCAKDEIVGDLLLLDGDYLMYGKADKVKKFFADQVLDFVTKETSSETVQDSFVRADETGVVLEVGLGQPRTGDYYATSIMYVPDREVPKFMQAIKECDLASTNNVLGAYPGKVYAADLGRPFWLEVDTQEDLARAEKFVKKL